MIGNERIDALLQARFRHELLTITGVSVNLKLF